MTTPNTTNETTTLFVIAGLVLAVFAFGVGVRPLLPIDETRYMSVAWEMYLSGDYLVPTKNGETYAHKPPLLFWLINLVWMVFGVSEFAGRMVGPVFSVLNICLTFVLARKLYPNLPNIASGAAAALASLFVYGMYTGSILFDAILTTCTLLFLLGVWMACVEGRFKAWLLCGAAIGFGVLAKGPVIFVHTVPVLLLSPFWADASNRVSVRIKGFALALLVGLVIVGLWLAPAVIFGGEAYREELLWKQTAGRVANAFDHARPVYWFAALLPLYLFPWVLHLDFWAALRRPGMPKAPTIFLTAQALGAFVAFSLIASKQAHYLVPIMPSLAILIAALLAGRVLRASRNITAILLAAVMVILAVYLAFFVPEGEVINWAPVSPATSVLALSVFAVVSLLVLRAGGILGVALWNLSFLTFINVWIALIPLNMSYDIQEFVQHFDGRDGSDIAYMGRPYHAEFGFEARLTEPVYLAKSQEDMRAWAAAHPNGLVIALRSSVDFVEEPDFTVPYRERPYGLWTSETLGY